MLEANMYDCGWNIKLDYQILGLSVVDSKWRSRLYCSGVSSERLRKLLRSVLVIGCNPLLIGGECVSRADT